MKRIEKTLQMYKKIINFACQEFSEKSFSEASINTICSKGKVSKGIIYHYFKDKDALYLACVKECFVDLTKYLNDNIDINGKTVDHDLANYFDKRLLFFSENPNYLGIFFSSKIIPPIHLKSSIKEITHNFDLYSTLTLNKILKKVELRKDISTEDIVDLFREYQDFVNGHFQFTSLDKSNFQEHEIRCQRYLKVLLYGVIERDV